MVLYHPAHQLKYWMVDGTVDDTIQTIWTVGLTLRVLLQYPSKIGPPYRHRCTDQILFLSMPTGNMDIGYYLGYEQEL